MIIKRDIVKRWIINIGIAIGLGVLAINFFTSDNRPAPEPTTADYINYRIKQERQEAIQKAKDEGLTPVVIINQ